MSPAKRYLVSTDPEYRSELDGGSITSLERQGGDMSPEEISEFESEDLSANAVTLRRADEAGKVPGLTVPGLDTWLDLLRAHDHQPQASRGIQE
jgi:predicted HD phosphohydrolase